MSSVQRRAKNIYQIPLIHLTENKAESTPITDPRSPSSNVTRTPPVDLQTYQLPNTTPHIHIK